MMSRASLVFFSELLSELQLNAGHPQFEEHANRVITARKEIAETIADLPEDEPTPEESGE